jgi:hypothetical protein
VNVAGAGIASVGWNRVAAGGVRSFNFNKMSVRIVLVCIIIFFSMSAHFPFSD